MKKYALILLLFVLILSTATACSRSYEKPAVKNPNGSLYEEHTTTAPEFTVGDEQTSRKDKTGNDSYEINYYDSNGLATKKEIYIKNVLKYYVVVSAVNEDGNSIQEEYYTADGKLFGVMDDGFFYDGKGNQISEDIMEVTLNNILNEE